MSKSPFRQVSSIFRVACWFFVAFAVFLQNRREPATASPAPQSPIRRISGSSACSKWNLIYTINFQNADSSRGHGVHFVCIPIFTYLYANYLWLLSRQQEKNGNEFVHKCPCSTIKLIFWNTNWTCPPHTIQNTTFTGSKKPSNTCRGQAVFFLTHNPATFTYEKLFKNEVLGIWEWSEDSCPRLCMKKVKQNRSANQWTTQDTVVIS